MPTYLLVGEVFYKTINYNCANFQKFLIKWICGRKSQTLTQIFYVLLVFIWLRINFVIFCFILFIHITHFIALCSIFHRSRVVTKMYLIYSYFFKTHDFLHSIFNILTVNKHFSKDKIAKFWYIDLWTTVLKRNSRNKCLITVYYILLWSITLNFVRFSSIQIHSITESCATISYSICNTIENTVKNPISQHL